MPDEPYSVCVFCGQRIDPDAPDTHRVVELVPAPSMGRPNDVLEGLGGHVHEGCFVPGAGYKLTE